MVLFKHPRVSESFIITKESQLNQWDQWFLSRFIRYKFDNHLHCWGEGGKKKKKTDQTSLGLGSFFTQDCDKIFIIYLTEQIRKRIWRNHRTEQTQTIQVMTEWQHRVVVTRVTWLCSVKWFAQIYSTHLCSSCPSAPDSAHQISSCRRLHEEEKKKAAGDVERRLSWTYWASVNYFIQFVLKTQNHLHQKAAVCACVSVRLRQTEEVGRICAG